jgi:hypothetical protein
LTGTDPEEVLGVRSVFLTLFFISPRRIHVCVLQAATCKWAKDLAAKSSGGQR